MNLALRDNGAGLVLTLNYVSYAWKHQETMVQVWHLHQIMFYMQRLEENGKVPFSSHYLSVHFICK